MAPTLRFALLQIACNQLCVLGIFFVSCRFCPYFFVADVGSCSGGGGGSGDDSGFGGLFVDVFVVVLCFGLSA